MGGLGEPGEESPERKSLLANCAALRDEIAQIIQGSREARRRFKRRLLATSWTMNPANSSVSQDVKKKKGRSAKEPKPV